MPATIKKSIEIKLPGSGQGSQALTWACDGPLLIIGANGAGKSRLGAWIEQNQQNPTDIHRISAQKSLEFGEYVQLTPLDTANLNLYLGSQYKSPLSPEQFVQVRRSNR